VETTPRAESKTPSDQVIHHPSRYRRREYVAMTRPALILVPLLLSSSPSYPQSKNASYYCAVDLTRDRWYSTKDQNFVLTMTLIGPHNSASQFDDYYVSITPSRSNVPIDCRGQNRSRVVSAEFDTIRCHALNIYYVFNQRRTRFWRLLLDWNSSGTCTKIAE
jgi:hypothetical protein